MERDDASWIDHLASPGSSQDAALLDLRKILRRGLDGALGRRLSQREAFIEDVVQEASMKVLGSLETFQGRSRFTTWAVAIAVRQAMGELRRRRTRDLSFESLVEDRELRLPAEEGSESSDGDLDRSKVLQVLQRVIDDRLTAKQRTVLRAKLEGLEQSEIARRLPGVKRNAVYKLAHDARKSLKRGLLEAGISEDTIRHAFDF
ncbi:MAG: RNA polymerase sigma factor [Acidobacteriota bacterium]